MAEPSPIKEITVGMFPLEDFRRLTLAGIFRRIVLCSDWTHFIVQGEMPDGSFANLSKTKKGELRRFLNPAAALTLLRRMGVVRVEVVMEAWDLELSSLTMRLRPDVTVRRRQKRRELTAEMMAHIKYGDADDSTAVWRRDREAERQRLADEKVREMCVKSRIAEADARHQAAARSVKKVHFDPDSNGPGQMSRDEVKRFSESIMLRRPQES